MPTSSPTQSEDSSPGYLCRGRTGAVELGNEVHLGGVNCVATVRISRSGETLGRTPRAGARYRPAAASSIAAHRACGRRDVHAAQGGIPARGVSGKNEANGGIVFAKGMPDLKLLAENGAARSPRLAKIPDIARIFRRQPASARYANRKRGRPARLPPQRFAKERGRCHKSDPSSTPVAIHA